MANRRYWAALVALFAAGTCASSAHAAEPDCRFLKVSTVALNIFKEPRAASDFIDRLEQNDIVCTIGRDQQVGDLVWTYVVYKLEKRNQRKALEGWGILRFLQPAAPAEVAALRGPREPAAPQPAAPPPATPPPAVPLPAAPPPVAPAPAESVVRFSDPIPFGPFPVNGHSLEELMIAGIPMFSPIEGLEDSVWKKTCNNCHKWDRITLCAQGGTYAKDPKTELRIPHPYGGAEKIAMMKWFQSGCQ